MKLAQATSDRAAILLSAILFASARTPAQYPSPNYNPAQTGINVVNMIPYQLSAEAHQDSEANVAVNPQNISQVAASAFIPGVGGNCADPTLSPVLFSADLGNTWALKCILPSSNPFGGTDDITLRYGPLDNVLYASILDYIGDPTFYGYPLNVLTTTDPTLSTTMQSLDQIAEGPLPCGVDQPYMEVGSWAPYPPPGKDRVYVGINDLILTNGCVGGSNGRTANMLVSLDAAAPNPVFNEDPLEARNTEGQDGPSVRAAVAISSDGVVYAAFIGWRTLVSSNYPQTVFSGDVVVARDDEGGSLQPAFHALLDPGDGLPGYRVVTQRQIIFDTLGVNFGQERFGSALSIAVHPTNSQLVYLAWCDDMPAAGHVLHLVRGTGSGTAWTPDILAIPQATNPSVAINSQGAVGLLYQQLGACAAGPSCWITHFVSSPDGFRTQNDVVLAATRSDVPVANLNPYIGDYSHLLAIGSVFFGAFAASNQPTSSNFPSGVLYNRAVNWTAQQLLDTRNNPVTVSIDPFFFSVGAPIAGAPPNPPTNLNITVQ